MVRKIYSVSGMKCEHCKANVEQSLKSLSGIQDAKVSLVDANVTVEFEENGVSPQQIKEVVDSCGRYELTL